MVLIPGIVRRVLVLITLCLFSSFLSFNVWVLLIFVYFFFLFWFYVSWFSSQITVMNAGRKYLKSDDLAGKVSSHFCYHLHIVMIFLIFLLTFYIFSRHLPIFSHAFLDPGCGWKGPLNYGLSFYPSVFLSGSFHGIGSLVFSETQHDARGLCVVA